VALLVPRVADRLEARMSRLAAFGPRSHGDGFRSGLLVGAALGFVYTPCAGPILAAVISVSAASGRSVAVGIAYTLGSAAVLLALTLGGRSLLQRVRRAGRGPALQRTLGAIMVLTAVVIITGEDVKFDQYVALHIPNVNLTAGLEKSHAVESRLSGITGRKVRFVASTKTPTAARDASQASLLALARGRVRYLAVGEGDYAQTESAIRALLAEAGAEVGGKSHASGVVVPSAETTPETYLGTARAQGWVNGPVADLHDYGSHSPADLSLNDFAYGGTWRIAGQPAEAVSGARIDMEFEARHVYLVLSSAGKRPRQLQVLLDGRPIPAADAGADVHGGRVTVTGERLYSLVSLPYAQRRHLALRFAPGISGYAFTFG
jgi:hypothetical protein